MGGYKHIEQRIGSYILNRYRKPVEIGSGGNFTAASLIASSGSNVRCTDIRRYEPPAGVTFTPDDIFSPDTEIYMGADLLYSIRPAPEMVPPMIELAEKLNCDLLVYHLGFECHDNGGEIIDCGVVLHRYYRKNTGINI